MPSKSPNSARWPRRLALASLLLIGAVTAGCSSRGSDEGKGTCPAWNPVFVSSGKANDVLDAVLATGGTLFEGVNLTDGRQRAQGEIVQELAFGAASVAINKANECNKTGADWKLVVDRVDTCSIYHPDTMFTQVYDNYGHDSTVVSLHQAPDGALAIATTDLEPVKYGPNDWPTSAAAKIECDGPGDSVFMGSYLRATPETSY